MDDKTLWVIYYSVTLMLSVMLMKESNDKAYKAIFILFVITFIYFLVSYLDVIRRSGFEFISMTIAAVWFGAKTIRSEHFQPGREVFLIMLPLTTVLRLAWKILHLTGGVEVSLISLFIVLATITYLLVFYFREGSFRQVKEAVHINGLFAMVLIPTLI